MANTTLHIARLLCLVLVFTKLSCASSSHKNSKKPNEGIAKEKCKDLHSSVQKDPVPPVVKGTDAEHILIQKLCFEGTAAVVKRGAIKGAKILQRKLTTICDAPLSAQYSCERLLEQPYFKDKGSPTVKADKYKKADVKCENKEISFSDKMAHTYTLLTKNRIVRVPMMPCYTNDGKTFWMADSLYDNYIEFGEEQSGTVRIEEHLSLLVNFLLVIKNKHMELAAKIKKEKTKSEGIGV